VPPLLVPPLLVPPLLLPLQVPLSRQQNVPVPWSTLQLSVQSKVSGVSPATLHEKPYDGNAHPATVASGAQLPPPANEMQQ
jgi:hypothetical protein